MPTSRMIWSIMFHWRGLCSLTRTVHDCFFVWVLLPSSKRYTTLSVAEHYRYPWANMSRSALQAIVFDDLDWCKAFAFVADASVSIYGASDGHSDDIVLESYCSSIGTRSRIAERTQYRSDCRGSIFEYEPVGLRLLHTALSSRHISNVQSWSCLWHKRSGCNDLGICIAHWLWICLFSLQLDVTRAPSGMVSSNWSGWSAYCTPILAAARKCPGHAGFQAHNGPFV